MPPNLPAARTLLVIVAASYVLSAVLLGVARLRGAAVGVPALVGWSALGLAGVGLASALGPGRPVVWAALLAVLAPWMVYAMLGDARHGAWVMVIADAAGLLAIAYGLWLAREALRP